MKSHLSKKGVGNNEANEQGNPWSRPLVFKLHETVLKLVSLYTLEWLGVLLKNEIIKCWKN